MDSRLVGRSPHGVSPCVSPIGVSHPDAEILLAASNEQKELTQRMD